MCHLICMSFDGEYVEEHNIFSENRQFPSIKAAWERSEDMGSRWFFYPFHFVVGPTKKVILEAPDGLEFFNNKHLNTVSKFFNKVANLPETSGAGVEEFCSFLYTIWHEERRNK